MTNLSIQTKFFIPYKHVTSYLNTNNEYVYLFIYQIINDIPIMIKILNTHIFMVYIPEKDKEEIESLFVKKDMKELSKLFFERYQTISSLLPYCNLGMFYMDTLPEKFSFNIKMNGHDNKLTELDIFSILYNLWRSYYSDNTYNLLNNSQSNKYREDTIHKETPIILFTVPYDYKQNKYKNLGDIILT